MGLFNDMKKLVKKSIEDKVDEAISTAASTSAGRAAMRSKEMVDNITGKVEQARIMPWRVEPYKGSVILEPLTSGKIYIYYPEPLRAIRKDERFVLEAIAGDVDMVSSYNGTKANTRDFGNIAYMYEGKVVGMSKYFCEAVRELLEDGNRVFVHAEKIGVYDKDVPEIVIYGNRDTERVEPWLAQWR